jgi:PAS domain S-box-containing protein
VVTLADITQIRRAEADLRRLATVVFASSDAITVQDLDGHFIEWNRAAQRIYGYTAAEARQLAPYELVPEEDLTRARGYREALKRGEEVGTVEVKRRTKDGRTLDVSLTLSTLTDDRGRPASVITIERDVSERKRADTERERLLAEVRRVQERVSADLEAMTRLQKLGTLSVRERHLEPVLGEIVDAAIAISGADFGNIQLLDPATSDLKIVAYRGFPDSWLEFWRGVSKGQGVCGTALERGERVIVEDVETSPIFADTAALDAQRKAGVRAVQSTPLLSRSGRTLGMFSTHYRKPTRPDDRSLRLLDLLARQAADIIERAQVEEELLRERAEADRRKNEFLAMLSHELRNPLAPIRNSLYLLAHAPPAGDQARRAQAIIDRQVGQMTRLVEDLLDVTRIARGKAQLQREILDINEVAQRTVEDHRGAFADGGIELEMAAAAEEIWVNGDSTRLSQVIGNLLQNAAKFTPRGGKTTVSVERDSARQQAIVRVQDTGRGIAPEDQLHLFEPFTQADVTIDRKKGGLGLGLAVVKGLVEMHGGSVTAASTGVDEGATFTITLPLEATGPAEAHRPRADAQKAVRRVLVIEDNEDAADSLREALELCGHEVEVAYTGSEGIEKARAFGPEVVICDIGLPEMDGYTVARALRADSQHARVTLIALSGYAGPEDLAKAKEAGFDGHLAKPPSMDAVERVLKPDQ